MDERELSKLSYLVQALARSPEQYESILSLTTNASLAPPSRDLQRALDLLREHFAKEFPQGASLALREANVRLGRIAATLLDRPDPSARSAGRSLAWALENRGAGLRSSR